MMPATTDSMPLFSCYVCKSCETDSKLASIVKVLRHHCDCDADCDAVSDHQLLAGRINCSRRHGAMYIQVLDVLGDAVTGATAAELLEQAGGSPRRAVNAFLDQSAG